MAKDWRCLIGLHDWREVEMPDRDKCAECTRCGKRDWRRLLTRTAGQWRGGDPPPGSLRGVGTQTRVTPRCHGPDIVNVSSEVREPRGTLLCRDPRSGLSQISWRTTVAHHPTEDTRPKAQCLAPLDP